MKQQNMLTSIITEALDNNTCALLELFSLKNRFEWVNEYFKMRIGAVIDKKAEKVNNNTALVLITFVFS